MSRRLLVLAGHLRAAPVGARRTIGLEAAPAGFVLRRAETLPIDPSGSLRGKTLFITGASRGIGLAIALRAARDGANVAIVAKTTEPHPRLPNTIYTAAKEVEAAGGSALPIACDIRFEDQVQRAVEQTVERFGGIDILVNNASAISLTPTEQTDMKRCVLARARMARARGRGT